MQIVIKKKTEKTLFDVCSSCRAPVIRAIALSLRASSYDQTIALSAIVTCNYKPQKGFLWFL